MSDKPKSANTYYEAQIAVVSIMHTIAKKYNSNLHFENGGIAIGSARLSQGETVINKRSSFKQFPIEIKTKE